MTLFNRFRTIILTLAAFIVGCNGQESPDCLNAVNGCPCTQDGFCLNGLACVDGVCRSGDATAPYNNGTPSNAGSEGGLERLVDAAQSEVFDAAIESKATDSAGVVDRYVNQVGSEADSSGDDLITDSSLDSFVNQPADSSIETESGNDAFAINCDSPRPVVFVHGVNGSSANYETMIQRLITDGWPEEFMYRFDAADPSWGCNIDNAEAIQQLVNSAIAETGYDRIDLVAHSMGTLSSRYYVKNLDGYEIINTYVTLGGMHHGLVSPCWSPIGMQCTWDELCGDRAFLTQLNDDPMTPGELYWISIYGTADTTVPNDSSYLEGAENIPLEGVTHSGPEGLLEHDAAYSEVRRVLSYSCW